MGQTLGDLKMLDARHMWPNESADFTPWLAADENISRLGDALGLELEVESTEVAVGPYAADILARDAGGNYVVIENQLGKTDHDHLGKAITYGAVLSAGAIVWLAAEFTEEHKKAIDWLNDNDSGDVSFYAVRIELWQIDDSQPALRFNVLSRPSEVAAIAKASGALSDAKKLQFEWWAAFRERLLSSKVVPSAQTAGPRYWFNVPLGRSGIHLSNFCDTYSNRIGVRVYLRKRYGGDAALAQLAEQQAQIEAEIGQPLIWDANPEALDKTIVAQRDVDLKEREKWPEHLDWMVKTTEKFRKTFAPRVKKLDLQTVEEPGEDPEGN